MTPPTQSPWGKVIGGFLGFCLAGPWGAAFGILVGHMHDSGTRDAPEVWTNLWKRYGDFSANAEQAVFTMGVVVLSAKMAKADGQVTRAEIDAFKRAFHISDTQETAIGLLFDRARRSAEGFEPYAAQLARVFQQKPAVLEGILSGLFIIAAADYAGLSPAEIIFLKRVSFIFGFGGEDFVRIAAQSGVNLPEREWPHRATEESFAVLGVTEQATPEEIKLAYRALIREHHPDKLMAQGMPPEFIATATEKMKRINSAYDTVCKIKGIK